MAKKEVTGASKLAFEAALQKLEALVENLETGETPLKELVEQYELGVAYLKRCQSELSAAELKIETLSENLNAAQEQLQAGGAADNVDEAEDNDVQF